MVIRILDLDPDSQKHIFKIVFFYIWPSKNLGLDSDSQQHIFTKVFSMSGLQNLESRFGFTKAMIGVRWIQIRDTIQRPPSYEKWKHAACVCSAAVSYQACCAGILPSAPHSNKLLKVSYAFFGLCHFLLIRGLTRHAFHVPYDILFVIKGTVALG